MATTTTYDINIFDDMKEEYNKSEVKMLLDEKEFPIYLMLTNYYEDTINVSDDFTENLRLGTVKLDYEKQVFHVTTDTTVECGAGELATVLLNTLKYCDNTDTSLFDDQTGVIFNNTPDGIKFQLLIGFGKLGMIMEEFYSVYFTGKTVTDIHYMDIIKDIEA